MLQRALNVARDLSRQIGEQLLNALPEPNNISTKEEADHPYGINLVTEQDERAEAFLTEELHAVFPEHDFLAEEGTSREEGSEYRWLIDPLDGTSNYAHAFPWFGVSLALEKQIDDSDPAVQERDRSYETILGMVRIPQTEETFHAIKGEGAYLNEDRINVSSRDPISNCMIATGFPYSRRTTDLPLYRDFENFTRSARSVRRAGAATIDLCYLAAGIFDGFWEWELHPWDTAAGCLIIREAGGRTTDFQGTPHNPFGDQTLASNGQVHEQMMQILQTGDPILP